MTLPIFPQQAVDMLGAVNGRPYDAKANPHGLANGGHRQVFPDSLQAMVEGLTYTQQVALALEVLARLVETSTADAKAAAETAAAQAIRAEGAATNAGAMSDAGKRFVGLGTYDVMFEAIMRPASNTKRGVVFFANESETIAGTDDISAITPKALRAWAEDWIKAKGLGAMDYSRTGWVSTKALQAGSGEEEARHIDIPITSVTDYRKCTVNFDGGAGFGTYGAMSKTSSTVSNLHSFISFKCTARFTSNVNLRISVCSPDIPISSDGTNRQSITIAGRWYVGAPS